MIDEKYEEEIREIKHLFNTAEADLKNIGRLKDALVVVCINQCRYVGQHLLRALTATDHEDIVYELDSAKRHAQRAVYDVNDSALQYYVTQIDKLRTTHFPTVDFAYVMGGSKYSELVTLVATAKSRIETTSDSLVDREAFYKEIRCEVASLKRAYEILVEFQPDFVRYVKKENAKKLVTWVGVATTAVALLGTVLRLWP